MAWRLFGPGYDEVLARVRAAGGGANWYLADRQGGVRAVLDAAGSVSGTRTYEAFGAVAASSGAGFDRYGYTGREWDAALALQYSRARLYDPASGRFTGEDPLGLAAGDVNLYGYVRNNPLGATDPSGNWEWWDRNNMTTRALGAAQVAAGTGFMVMGLG